jgi:hypothetical protein
MTLDSFQIVLVDLATHVLFVAARQNLTLLGTEYVSVTLAEMQGHVLLVSCVHLAQSDQTHHQHHHKYQDMKLPHFS